ncbi:MAG: pilus assembly protein [Chloroflexi bacterium]|nr:pilus assembly protein [Chloroflexota bacterium]
MGKQATNQTSRSRRPLWRRLGRRADGGQAIVELALILPVFVMLAFGLVDFGRIFYTYQALVNAAREGARYCAQNADGASTPAGAVAAELDGRITTDAITVRLEPAGAWGAPCPNVAANPDSSAAVTVRVTATFTPITPFVDRFMRDPSTGNLRKVAASAVMPVWN